MLEVHATDAIRLVLSDAAKNAGIDEVRCSCDILGIWHVSSSDCISSDVAGVQGIREQASIFASADKVPWRTLAALCKHIRHPPPPPHPICLCCCGYGQISRETAAINSNNELQNHTIN